MFKPDARIEASSHPILDLPLCTLRLQDDARYPWIVLVPRLPGLTEIEHLSPADRVRVIEEATRAGTAVRAIGEALGRPVEKLNLGALGNIVAQLHVHVVGRRADDATWPGPVWGAGVPAPYAPQAREKALIAARGALALP